MYVYSYRGVNIIHTEHWTQSLLNNIAFLFLKTLVLLRLHHDHVRKDTMLSTHVHFAFRGAWERGYTQFKANKRSSWLVSIHTSEQWSSDGIQKVNFCSPVAYSIHCQYSSVHHTESTNIALNWINSTLISGSLQSWIHSWISTIEFLVLDWIMCFINYGDVCLQIDTCLVKEWAMIFTLQNLKPNLDFLKLHMLPITSFMKRKWRYCSTNRRLMFNSNI